MSGAGAMSGAGNAAGTGNAPGAGNTSAAGTGAPEVAGPVIGPSNPITSLAEMEARGSSNLDFNSVDLLIALLLMAAGRDKEDEDSAGATALGFLAGLAMAGELGRMDFSVEFDATAAADSSGAETAGGGQLNVTA